MRIYVQRRVVERDGYVDESLVAMFPDDVKKLHKIPTDRPSELEIKVKRSPERNGQIWALCSYFVEHLPERFYSVDEISGDSVPMLKTKEQVYKYVAHRIGWTEILKIGDEIVEFVDDTRFDKLKDELEYMDNFYYPFRKELAIMADMTVEQLIEGSIENRKEKMRRR